MKRKFEDIRILSNGNGEWHITMRFNKRQVSTITKNAQAIKDYKSDKEQRDTDDGRTYVKTRGYNALRKEIASAYAKIIQCKKQQQ